MSEIEAFTIKFYDFGSDFICVHQILSAFNKLVIGLSYYPLNPLNPLHPCRYKGFVFIS